MRRVTILGSTGSIGTAAIDVVAGLGDGYAISGLAAGNRWQQLADQARSCKPAAVCLGSDEHRTSFEDAIAGCGVKVVYGQEGLEYLATRDDCDIVVSAIVGIAGLRSTLAAIEAGKMVALANKESLVVAGPLLGSRGRASAGTLLPVDSEHSAIFQALQSGSHGEVRRILLTASGGAFRDWPEDRKADATLDEALCHPTWNMGPKITVDSATLMNKALEVIEARYLFDVSAEQIQVVIHPESIVHSMVEFCDGSIVAQLGPPDMRIPIQYALTYPARCNGLVGSMDLSTLRSLHFDPADEERYPALGIGFEVARRGGTTGAVANAANERAVEWFMQGRIRFGQIVELVRYVLDRHINNEQPSLDDVLDADCWARSEVDECLNR